MPSTNKTKHGLNPCIENDIPDMVDFNDDNQKIDAFMSHAVGDKPFQAPVSAWEKSEYISYPYETVIPVSGLTANNDAPPSTFPICGTGLVTGFLLSTKVTGLIKSSIALDVFWNSEKKPEPEQIM